MRFIISNRRAGKLDESDRKAKRDDFDKQISRSIAGSFNILADSAELPAATEESRRMLFFEGDHAELLAKKSDFGTDAIIEPERPRTTLEYKVADFVSRAPGTDEVDIASAFPGGLTPVGTGATFDVKITGKGAPVKNATLTLVLISKASAQSVRELATVDDTGKASIAYDPSLWDPHLAVLEPVGGFWPIVISSPASGLEVNLPELPKSGPYAWWHGLVGSTGYSEKRGEGIRLGVADTGFGPHPYLSHVKGIGAFIGGKHDPSADATRDSMTHGTHVTGTIGARPPEGSGDFGGIAAGADLFVARVFEPNSLSNQGDIANAIDELSGACQVDLINMSLGGAYSDLEHDAILAAQERGTLCICAAGNNFGGHVLFPGAYPQSVAISALGLVGVVPQGSASYINIPTLPDRMTSVGLFLANFSNIGPEITCIAPGNGIISTVPASADLPSPYFAMDGTSMASPVATATLAALLAGDPNYKNLPRTAERAAYAGAALRKKAQSVGLSALYQGLGLTRM